MSRARVTLDHLIEARNRYLSAAACLAAASDVTATPSPASLLFRRTYYSKVEGVRVPTNGLSPTILAPDTDYVFALANTTNKNGSVNFDPTFVCRDNLLGPYYQ